VAESASVQRFVPVDRPRVVVAADGTLAAIHERARIVVTDVPGCTEVADIGIDGDAQDSDVAWVGTPPRLLVLSHYAAHSTVHLVDPLGPRTIAELRLESAMRLRASVGNHALVIGATGAAVLTATDRGVTPHPFPTRAVPATAGTAGAQFVVALPGTIEEWDPQSRLPKRRLKLPRPAQITAVGGSDRVVWMTTQQAPARVEVIPLVNRGQPKVHELPEPIAHVASHPRSDLIACIGASTGRVWVIDLDGQAGQRLVDPEGIDHVDGVDLVVGRAAGVIAAQAGRPIAMVALESTQAALPTTPGTPPRPMPDWTAPMRSLEQVRTWRDELAAWATARQATQQASMHHASTAVPEAPPIDAMVSRYDLTPALGPVLALLYAAHLNGAPGAAPIDVARLAGWPEALGRGELADKQLAIYRDSRVHLVPHVQRALDELAPRTGTIVGVPGAVSLLGPCAIVAAGPLLIIADTCVSSIGGAILAAHDGADLRELVCEARAYGAAAMVRASGAAVDHIPSDQPIILVTDDERTADRLGVPRLT
jgi:hypothetical protein